MGNMSQVPVAAPSQTTNKMKQFFHYNHCATSFPKNYNINNKSRQADRYSRNGSNRGNGIRSS